MCVFPDQFKNKGFISKSKIVSFSEISLKALKMYLAQTFPGASSSPEMLTVPITWCRCLIAYTAEILIASFACGV